MYRAHREGFKHMHMGMASPYQHQVFDLGQQWDHLISLVVQFEVQIIQIAVDTTGLCSLFDRTTGG